MLREINKLPAGAAKLFILKEPHIDLLRLIQYILEKDSIEYGMEINGLLSKVTVYVFKDEVKKSKILIERRFNKMESRKKNITVRKLLYIDN